MELKEMIKVMQHFADGGKVECRIKGGDSWSTFSNYYWNWYAMDYRIKEEKEKVTIEKWLCRDISNGEYFMYESDKIDLYIKETINSEKVKLIETYEIEL